MSCNRADEEKEEEEEEGPLSSSSLTLSFWDRFKAEINCGMFDVQEPPPPQKKKIIDLVRTFQPQTPFDIVVKTLLTLYIVTSLIYLLFKTGHFFWLAYLTHWSYLTLTLYFLCSCIWLFHAPTRESRWLQLTWILYSVAATTQILVFVLFWVIEYALAKKIDKPTIEYRTIVTHGISMVLILVDGVVMRRIPVRAKHYMVVFVWETAFIVWTGIHAATNIGNPLEDEKDAIYSIFSWKNDPVRTSVIAAINLFIVSPLLFWFLWALSAYGGLRRRGNNDDNSDGDSVGGCCFCRFDGSHRFYMRGAINMARKDTFQMDTFQTEMFDAAELVSEEQHE